MAPAEAAPAEAAPAEAAPAEAAPAETPAEAAPAEAAPVEPAPADAPVDEAPVDEAPADAAEPVDSSAAPPVLPHVPEHRFLYSNITIARINPLGLFNGLTLSYRKRLLDRPDSKLFRDSYFGIGVLPSVSPAVAQIGPLIEIQPLAIFKFSAQYFFTGWFGTFDYFQSFEDSNSEYTDQTLDANTEAGLNYPNTSHQIELKALLQAKVGPVAVRNTVMGYWNSTNTNNPNHQTWYTIKYDILLPTQGWMIGNETDLIYVSKFGLVAGLRNNLLAPHYPAEGVGFKNPNGPAVRLGPLFAYTFYDKPQKRFNKPTLILISQWHLQHRNRTGLSTSQALPTIVLAFAFSGDLWTSDKNKKDREKQAAARREQRRAAFRSPGRLPM